MHVVKLYAGNAATLDRHFRNRKQFKMSLTAANTFKKGEFVFAKMKGYRAWPARILQSEGQVYNVFFYGTCNTAKLDAKYVYSYEKCKRRLGNTEKLRQKEFKRAMLHAELMVANPNEDEAYNYFLSSLERDNYLDDTDAIQYNSLK